ncbi:hypothetical protein [Cellulomonas septica]|uniref:Uncharacterized protein n=1 Tax=Cellulomonas septica TaxID=285080 RepID=A0ABX1JY36_9CELL|nr:hypothetical protein [Cellulomonas septica]NKY38136.1 hypothetical protein [Cellulomonas septica]
MAIVKYPRYRQYEGQRIQTNDTVMGLLAGSALASRTLGLTSGSDLVLSQIFPQIPHIERFNLKTATAQSVLDNAEPLLGILAVPQVLAIHEDLLRSMLELLAEAEPRFKPLLDNFKTFNAHERIESATGAALSTESVALFHLVRVARNTHIHSGGRADTALVNRIEATEPGVMATWQSITRTPFPAYRLGDPVTLGLAELIGILALTKRLAEEANVALQTALPRSVWATIVVRDWASEGHRGNRDQEPRALVGYARHNYGPLQLTPAELEEAKSGLAP